MRLLCGLQTHARAFKKEKEINYNIYIRVSKSLYTMLHICYNERYNYPNETAYFLGIEKNISCK